MSSFQRSTEVLQSPFNLGGAYIIHTFSGLILQRVKMFFFHVFVLSTDDYYSQDSGTVFPLRTEGYMNTGR